MQSESYNWTQKYVQICNEHRGVTNKEENLTLLRGASNIGCRNVQRGDSDELS